MNISGENAALQSKNHHHDEDNNKTICAIIGPEGDFSEKERELILSFKNVKPININQNILRSETATIAIISIINYILSS